uniref:Uncharacterized protein n=1 Tax=Anguilla anguilla TaxID=7936 RepID=A0A0E9UED7_ANGAN
MMLPPSHLR